MPPALPPGQRKVFVGVKLDPASLDAVDQLAEALGVPRSVVIRDALAAGLPTIQGTAA